MPAAAAATATATATASETAMLLCFLLSGRSPAKEEEEGRGGDGRGGGGGRKRTALGPTKAPETWCGEMAATAGMLGFIWSELLRKWPVMDLAFGVKYLMRRRGNLQVASVYIGNNCVQLKGHGITAELIRLLRILNLCMFFSKKPFRVFLKSGGYSQQDVILKVSKAGILKPAFTILRDKNSNCFLLIIRGMHSMKDLLTALNGAVVPFHHSILHEGGVCKSVLGYAHCGMAAAARWIAKCATPYLLEAFNKYPGYNIKIVGNSLGGGTASLLTYILREREEFSSSSCVAFAPAACMTWDLAESGKHFITTIINGADQVPSCSMTSISNLRSEVSSSSWLSDLWAQVQRSRFLSAINHFTSSLGSHLASISCASSRARAHAPLHPVSSKTQVFMRRAQFPSPEEENAQFPSTEEENAPGHCTMSRKDTVSLTIGRVDAGILVDGPDFGCSSSPDNEETEGDKRIRMYRVTTVSMAEKITDGELRFELVKELHRRDETDAFAWEEAADVKETTDDENIARQEAVKNTHSASPDAMGMLQFYPPGRIMHMVSVPASDSNTGVNVMGNESIGIYETPRSLYCKIQLSKRMIKDHYMTMYKKTMELLIDRLEKDEDACLDTLL